MTKQQKSCLKESSEWQIRRLSAHDAAVFREVRLRALAEEPLAFGSSAEEQSKYPLDFFAKRLMPPDSAESGMFGAFDQQGILVGTLGFNRETGLKRRHIAAITAVYVVPECRGLGCAAKLLDTAIAHARTLQGLRQVQLAVSVPMVAARKLYHTRGFESYGLERAALCVNGSFIDEDHLVLFLHPTPVT